MCVSLCVSVCVSVSVCVKPYNRHWGGTAVSGITDHTLVIWGTKQGTDKATTKIHGLIVKMCECQRVNPEYSVFSDSSPTWVADRAWGFSHLAPD